MAWVYLLVAGACEVAFALGTKWAAGFTRLGPTVFTVVAALLGVFFLSRALETLPVGLGYSIWTSIGTVGAVLFGAVFFGDSITPAKLFGLALILAGVVSLQIAGEGHG